MRLFGCGEISVLVCWEYLFLHYSLMQFYTVIILEGEVIGEPLFQKRSVNIQEYSILNLYILIYIILNIQYSVNILTVLSENRRWVSPAAIFQAILSIGVARSRTIHAFQRRAKTLIKELEDTIYDDMRTLG